MNVFERLWKSLNHEEPDRVPTFTQTIEGEFIRRYKEKMKFSEKYDIHLLELARELGYDSKWVHCEIWSSVAPEREKPEIPSELA